MDAATLIMVFTALFILQTIIYTALLLRLKRRLTSSRPAQALLPRVPPPAQRDITEPGRLPDSVIQALRALRGGALSAREVSSVLGLSREHTARLLKRMVEDGLVIREGKPYRYHLTSLGASLLKKASSRKEEPQEK